MKYVTAFFMIILTLAFLSCGNENANENEWRKDYADFLEEYLTDSSGFYIGDINGDGIPEAVISYNETNSGVIAYYNNNGFAILDLEVISLWGKVGYLEETKQLIIQPFREHTTGTFGFVDYIIYEWINDDYIPVLTLNRESGNYDVSEYEQGYINGEPVEFIEFEDKVKETDALLYEKSTWFPMTEANEIEDYLEYLNQFTLN